MTTVRHLLMTFDLPLVAWRVPAFRSAMIEWAGREHDLLHNHLNPPHDPDIPRGGFRYRYPLVQYRTNKGKAALFAMNEGADVVADVLSQRTWQIILDGEPTLLRIADLQLREHTLVYTDTPCAYQIRNWMALNQQNYREYMQMNNIDDQTRRLEQLLSAQIITFANYFHWQIPEHFDLNIHQFKQNIIHYHGQKLIGIDALFSVPLSLPYNIGLGKASSHGFGVLQRSYK